MILNKLLSVIITTTFLLNAFIVNSVENSVVPLMNKFETIENLNSKKFPKRQFSEIKSALTHKHERIRLATFNILAPHHDDKLDTENRWPNRWPRVIEAINEMQLDIVGIQELYPDRMQEFLPHVQDTYNFIAKPCSDGEHNGILFRKDRFELVDSQIWNMTANSETLTMVTLKDLMTGKIVAVFNTHLAFSNINKREEQAIFIAEKIEEYASKMPVILTGDLNTFSCRLEMQGLPGFDGDHVQRILTKGSLKNSHETSLLGHLGPISTFTNASQDPCIPFTGIGTPGIILDHIFTSKDVVVLMHAVQSGTIEKKFPSDHMPVLIDFILAD